MYIYKRIYMYIRIDADEKVGGRLERTRTPEDLF